MKINDLGPLKDTHIHTHHTYAASVTKQAPEVMPNREVNFLIHHETLSQIHYQIPQFKFSEVWSNHINLRMFTY